jgi:UrcA family protein
MNTFLRSSTLALLAGLATTIDTAPVSAALPEYTTNSVKVSFADLDLSTNAGAETLYKRIQLAANQVCGSYRDRRSMKFYQDWKTCRSQAIENAVAKVDRPTLTAVHSNKTGSTRVAAVTPGR